MFRNLRVPTLLIATLVMFSSLALSVGRVSALSGGDFQAGRIIDDVVFFNSVSIDGSGVQAFLNSKVPTCDTNGTKAYAGTTRAAYGTSKGYPPPYTCLKDYSENVPAKSAEVGLCGEISAGTKTAAQIIQEVGLSCGINQRVLIVLLEKEQSLVTDDWPWSIQYRSATGFGCPDTAACDSTYYGFFNQVYNAARQYRRYQRDETLFSYRKFRSNYIQYNPVANCGGSNVYIQNQATAGLYNYTPYQPNASALASLTGSGDSCAAYGNRNFWYLYNNWFGSTLSDPSHPDGTFVRNDSDGSIYYIEGGQRRYVTSMSVLNSYASPRPNWLKPATLADKILPVGANMTYPEGTVLRSTEGNIYVTDIDTTGITKRQIQSMNVFQGLGYTYYDIINVSPSELPTNNGVIIDTTSAHPDGTLIRDPSNGSISLIDTGKKRAVSSLAIFNSLRNNGKLKTATSIDVDLPKDTNPVNYPEGAVLRATDNPSIYVTDYNEYGLNRRPIVTQRAFDVLGYGYGDIVFVTSSDLPTQPGLAIQ